MCATLLPDKWLTQEGWQKGQGFLNFARWFHLYGPYLLFRQRLPASPHAWWKEVVQDDIKYHKLFENCQHGHTYSHVRTRGTQYRFRFLGGKSFLLALSQIFFFFWAPEGGFLHFVEGSVRALNVRCYALFYQSEWTSPPRLDCGLGFAKRIAEGWAFFFLTEHRFFSFSCVGIILGRSTLVNYQSGIGLSCFSSLRNEILLMTGKVIYSLTRNLFAFFGLK